MTHQQYLEILANMGDAFAVGSVVARTSKLLRAQGASAVPKELDITGAFVASANQRIADGARRLIANELVAGERDESVGAIERVAPDPPIATIAAKARIPKRIVAGDVRFLIE